MIPEIDFTLVVAAAVTALVVLYRLRKRRRKPDIDIPPFLRGTADPGTDTDCRFKGSWTEVHPLPRHIAGSDD